MAITVKDLSTADTKFPYAFIKGKLALKRAKKGHFYPKNDPNDKIGHIVYLDGFN